MMMMMMMMSPTLMVDEVGLMFEQTCRLSAGVGYHGHLKISPSGSVSSANTARIPIM